MSAHYEVAESGKGCAHSRWLTHMSRFLLPLPCILDNFVSSQIAIVDSFSLLKNKMHFHALGERAATENDILFSDFTRYSSDILQVW